MSEAPAIVHNAREQWLLRRRSLITASDVAAIVGENPHRTPSDVYLEKVGLAVAEESLPMMYGTVFQDGVGAVYSKVTGRRVKMASLELPEIDIHPDVPWLGCTRDGDVWGSADNPAPPPAVRAKDPRDDEHAVLLPGTLETKVSELRNLWEEGEDVPPHFFLQSQIQQACTGRHWGVVAMFKSIRRAPKSQDILFDGDLFKALLPRLEAFRACVLKREPPVRDPSWFSAAAVKALYKTDNGEVRDIPGDLIKTVDEWAAMRADRLVEEKKEEELQKQIRLAMGAAAIGILPDGRFLTLSTVHVKAHQRSASTHRTLTLTDKDPRNKKGKK